MSGNVKEIINRFNDSISVNDTLIDCRPEVIIKRNQLNCPFCDGSSETNSSIKPSENIFSCWRDHCLTKAKPWDIIAKHIGTNDFYEVVKFANERFNANIDLDKKRVDASIKELFEGDIIEVNQYMSEANDRIYAEAIEHEKLLINGATGLGKTYAISEVSKRLNTDIVVFIAPTRVLVEQVAATKDYNFSSFYGNMQEPSNDNTVMTYKKIDRLLDYINMKNSYRALEGKIPLTVTVIVDEIHELMSNRKMNGHTSIKIQNFILDSDYAILMSANTKDIYNAYKDTGLFNKLITIKPKNKIYNLDTTKVLRVAKNRQVRTTQILNTIKENLKTHDKILMLVDHKEYLEELKYHLENEGITSGAETINSRNKDGNKNFKSIVEDGILINQVTFVTSVINAGVNIYNENVCTIIYQDKISFDPNKIEQFLGRVRGNHKNSAIIMLNQGEYFKAYNKAIEIRQAEYINLAEANRSMLSTLWSTKFDFDKFGMVEEWKKERKTERYFPVKDLLYVSNECLKVDNIQAYEMARLDYERAYYYNDEYLKLAFKGIKTKSIEFLTLVSEEKTVAPETSVISDGVIFSNKLTTIKEASYLFSELSLYVKGEIEEKDLRQDFLKDMFKELNETKIFKEFKSRAKRLFPDLKIFAPLLVDEILGKMMDNYIMPLKPKDRKESFENMNRSLLLNRAYPLGTDFIACRGIGDVLYWATRKNLDCFVKRADKRISKRHLVNLRSEYLSEIGCKFYSFAYYNKRTKEYFFHEVKGKLHSDVRLFLDVWIDKNDKKVDTDKIDKQLESCKEAIYELNSDRSKILKLK